MAYSYKFMDGFDFYNTEAYLQQKWSGITGASGSGTGEIGTGATFETGGNRRGSSGQSLGLPSGVGLAGKHGSSTNLQVGAALMRPSAFARIALVLFDTSMNIAALLRWNADGSFSVLNQAGTVVATSAVAAAGIGTWYFIEFAAESQTSGNAWFSVNGIQYGPYVGNYKGAAGFASYGGGGVGVSNATTGSTGGTLYVDDYYALGIGGSDAIPAFLGNASVKTQPPIGSGAYSGWVGSDGDSVNNYALIDEQPPDSSDFVSASSNATNDTYRFATPTPGTVVAVQMNAVAKRGSTGISRLGFIRNLTGSAGTITTMSNAIGNGQIALSFTLYVGMADVTDAAAWDFGISALT